MQEPNIDSVVLNRMQRGISQKSVSRTIGIG